MSYSFTAATDALQTATTRVPSASTTMSIWVKNPTVTGTAQKCIADLDYCPVINFNANEFAFGTTATAGDLFLERSRATSDGSGQRRPSGVTWTVWNHILAGIDGSTGLNEGLFYVNGVLLTRIAGQAGSGTLDVSPARKLTLGNKLAKTVSCLGLIAEYAEWDTQLTQDQISALAAGVYPLSIGPRPIRYWPLKTNGDLTDKVASEVLTATGATWSSDHPTILDPANIDATTKSGTLMEFDPVLFPKAWF